ncbi:alpha/beta hydrolase [Planctomycetota bacterium]
MEKVAATRPLLLIHGTADAVIPHAESERLAEAAGGRAQLWLVQDAGHAGSMARSEYKDRLGAFFARKPSAKSCEPPSQR